ncbi:anti-anti-sigma regulatory factor [Kineococcus xinjiangensis]|uniref:Anti-anti-sigma regulatory factor n=1 Tax=Kineococcus xinjiangensis TaxID=512762 RepID=A0A2S6IPE8_9ACTN|nr:STAS domain-containing protein [Kineococcus xinjiangensis]PPK96099.1 anti-anti-sigma regulatory factor [Kineococcus xinjiangensis]
MEIHGNDEQGTCVLTVNGPVGSTHTHRLQTALIEELGRGGGHDLILDMRQVTSLDDAALAALTTGRQRAKFLHRRIVVVDGDDGATTRALRRSGHIFRFPVYADADAAGAALTADRSAVAARNATRPAGVRAG